MHVSCYWVNLQGGGGQEIYRTLMVRLNTCRLSHPFRENPIIREDWIRDF
ncbi:hypothetical protein Hanom_Chr04g00336631 [Helianthus anomalus]